MDYIKYIKRYIKADIDPSRVGSVEHISILILKERNIQNIAAIMIF